MKRETEKRREERRDRRANGTRKRKGRGTSGKRDATRKKEEMRGRRSRRGAEEKREVYFAEISLSNVCPCSRRAEITFSFSVFARAFSEPLASERNHSALFLHFSFGFAGAAFPSSISEVMSCSSATFVSAIVTA